CRPIFSPEGGLLAGLGDGQVQLWDIATGRRQRALQKGCSVLAFSPDGRTLACGDSKAVTLWELTSGKVRWRIEMPATSRVEIIRFTADGRWLAWAELGTIQFWDVLGGRQVGTLRGHNDWVTGLVFAPDSRRLASSSRDSTILVWNVDGVVARQP